MHLLFDRKISSMGQKLVSYGVFVYSCWRHLRIKFQDVILTVIASPSILKSLLRYCNRLSGTRIVGDQVASTRHYEL